MLRVAKRAYGTLNRSTPEIFNRYTNLLHRDWAARNAESRSVEYLRSSVAARLSERLLDIKQRFSHIVDIGAGPGLITEHIDDEFTQKITLCDRSEAMLLRDDLPDIPGVTIERKVLDEEQLNFDENSIPCAISSGLTFHWTNDLLGTLIQINRALVPDGVFLGALIGGETLFELRSSFQMVQMEREGGMGSRVSPMTHTADVGGLLGRAGFVLTTIDTDVVKVGYPSPWELMNDLRLMGDSQALAHR